MLDVTTEAPASLDAPVKTESGLVRGVRIGNALVYKGIPYAAPPVGALRWRPPQPAEPWDGIRMADAYGPVCPQHDLPIAPFPVGEMSEDCLTLNVTAPSGAAHDLPVMVWVTGGAFVAGGGSWPVYDGRRYVDRGVILVTFNYRVGRFGYFAHPALTAEADARGEPPTNFGLLDILAVLGWVKRNIAAFGGNPDNVTLAGHSAGAVSVAALLSSPGAVGLFQRAIAQSGMAYDNIPHLRAPGPNGEPSWEQVGEAFAASLGVPDADAAALRALSADEILGPPPEAGDIGALSLARDDHVLMRNTVAAFTEGVHSSVPLLIGTTDRELDVWIVKDFSTPPNLLPASMWLQFPGFQFPAEIVRTWFGADFDAAMELYRSSGLTDEEAACRQLQLEHIDVVTRHIAERMSAAGAPAFVYRFSAVPSAMRAQSTGLPHAGEIAYVFGSFDTIPAISETSLTDEDMAVSEAVLDYWAAFCRTGDPNCDGRPAWPRYQQMFGDVMEIGNGGPRVVGDTPTGSLEFLSRRLEPVAFELDRGIPESVGV